MLSTLRFIKNVYWLVFILVMLTLALGWNMATAVSPVDNIRGVEPNVVYTVQTLLADKPIYPDPEEPPFMITQYTPLYYILTAETAQVLGLEPGVDVIELYRLGRLISLACCVLLALSTYCFSRLLTHSEVIRFVLVLVVLVIPIPWYTLIRIDSLSGFLGILPVYLYGYFLVRVKRHAGSSRAQSLLLLGCGFVAYLSFLTKQNQVLFWMIIASYALFRRKITEFVLLSVGSLISAIVTSLLFSDIYSILPNSHHYFYAHVVGGINNGFSWSAAIDNLYLPYFRQYGILLALVLAASIELMREGIRHLRLSDRPEVYFLAWAAIVTTGVNLVSGLKIGSASNYMNEAIILSAVFLVAFVSQHELEPLKQAPFARLAASMVLSMFLVVQLVGNMWVYRGPVFFANQNSQSYQTSALLKFLSQELAGHPGALIYSSSDKVNNYFFDRVIFPQSEITALSVKQGVLTLDKLPALIAKGQLRYIVLRATERIPTQLFGHPIQGNLTLIDTIEAHNIYLVSPVASQ